MQRQFPPGPFEDVNQIIQQRDLYGKKNLEFENQLSHITLQTNAMLGSKDQIISQLTAHIAALKAERNYTARSFSTDTNGNVRSSEPNGTHKEIGVFKIESFHFLFTEKNGKNNPLIILQYQSGIEMFSFTVIPLEEINTRNLMKYFSSFKRKCSKQLANEFLYSILMDCIQSTNIKNIFMPEFPGLMLNKKNGDTKSVSYLCCAKEIPDFIRPYVSYPYQSKILPLANEPPEKIAAAIPLYLKSLPALVLLAFRFTGMLSTYLEDIHLFPLMILVISAYNADSEALVSCILKCYNCNKPPKSLTISKTELTRLLNESKDETVVLIDDTTSESKVKRSSSLDVICSERSNEKYKPHNTAIISKTIQHQLPGGKALVLDIDETFGNISAKERSELCKYLNTMTRFFIDAFCNYFSDYGKKLQVCAEELKKEVSEILPTEDSRNTFAVLCSVLNLWSCIFNIPLPNNMQDFMLTLIQNSI